MALATREIQPNRLERDELELLQRRALRKWRDLDALAAIDPAAWERLADFGDEIWIDLCQGDAPQEPGAIVVSPYVYNDRARRPDLFWPLGEGVPAADGAVDRIFIAADTLVAQSNPAALLRDCGRALAIGGSLIVGGNTSIGKDNSATLDDLGFAVTTAGRRQLPRPLRNSEAMYSLTKKIIRSDALGNPLDREIILGETGPRRIRTPSSWG